MGNQQSTAATEHWPRLRELFHSALEHPPAERRRLLRTLEAENPRLRRALEDLLSAHEDAGGFLERPFSRLLDSGPEDSPHRPVPQLLGAYELVERLGRGGMGTVYSARRADREYEDLVAIKILRRERITPELIRRFRVERQLLADLRHPNIAQLLDGGTTDDGRPFLVMEYVDGVSLDRYCEQHSPSLEAKLRLFIEICRAVQKAHQRLVVHRDLKPANILVNRQGEPKLLDFGIAKILRPSPLLAAGSQTSNLAPMTLEYASPEQLGRGPATTGSDVYSLGVILFELLTGRRPHRWTDQPAQQFLREVTEQKAPLASRSLDGAKKHVPWHRRLSGDLDRILAKALEKEAGQRYASANELAEDLRRYLEGMPILARPSSTLYTLGKLIGRHRWLSFGTFLVISAFFLLHHALLKERQAAEGAVSILSELFAFSDPEALHSNPQLGIAFPEVSRADQISAAEALEWGAERVQALLQKEPDVLGRILVPLGTAFLGLGAPDRAAPYLEQAVEALPSGFFQRRGPKVEARLRLADTRLALGNYNSALALYDEALRLARQSGSSEAIFTEQALAGQSRTLWRMGRFSDALKVQRRALDQARQLYSDDPLRIVVNRINLGDLQRELGKRQDAESSYRQALHAIRRTSGPKHPLRADALQDLGVLAIQSGHTQRARFLFERSLSLRREIYPPKHPKIAQGLHHWALLLNTEQQHGEAERFASEALSIRQELLGAQHPATAESANLLGLIQADLGNNETAEGLHRQALGIWREALGPLHPWIASARNNLGRALVRQGRHREALGHLAGALAIYRLSFGEEHTQIARVLNNLGAAQRALGELQEAEQSYRQALWISRKLLGDGHSDLAIMTYNLAVALRSLGQAEKAEPLFRSTLKSFSDLFGDHSPQVALCRLNLARALIDLDRVDEAAPLLRQTLAALEATFPNDHPWLRLAREQWKLLEEHQSRAP